MKLVIFFYCNIVISQTMVNLGYVYMYEDKDMNYFTGKLNQTEEWLACQVTNFKDETNLDSEIKFLSFNDEKKKTEYASMLTKINPLFKKPYFAYRFNWSKSVNNKFYFLRNENDIKGYFTGYFDDNPSYKVFQYSIETIHLGGEKLTPTSSYVVINDDDGDGDGDIYYISNGGENSDRGNIKIKTPSESIEYSNSISHYETLSDFDVYYNEDKLEYNLALTIIDGGENRDVFYYSDIQYISNSSLGRKVEPSDFHQLDPKFNYNGTLVAFLSQVSDGTDEYDIYIYNTSTNESKLIAQNVYSAQKKGTRPDYETLDYCWHPFRNIIFYVALVGKNENKQIKYCNIDSFECYDLETNTIENSNITISPKGNFLLFQTLGYQVGDKHFDNCNKNKDNKACCSGTANTKLAIAKISLN